MKNDNTEIEELLSEGTESEKLLDIKQTTSILKVSIQTVERLIKQRKLGSYKIAGRVLVSEEKHLQPYLKSCERPAQV